MNRIKKLREEQGIKQSALAKDAHISKGYLSRLENGCKENPSYTVMKNFANALGKNIGEVFDDTPP